MSSLEILEYMNTDVQYKTFFKVLNLFLVFAKDASKFHTDCGFIWSTGCDSYASFS